MSSKSILGDEDWYSLIFISVFNIVCTYKHPGPALCLLLHTCVLGYTLDKPVHGAAPYDGLLSLPLPQTGGQHCHSGEGGHQVILQKKRRGSGTLI